MTGYPRPTIWIVWYAVALHLVWGLALFAGTSPLGVTSIHQASRLVTDRWMLAATCVFVACSAVYGLKQRNLVALLPQQAMLVVSATGALIAMRHGAFADGVQRAHPFLIADQAPAVLAAFFHTAALLTLHRRH